MNLTLEYDSFQDFANKLWPCLSEEGMWISSDNPAGVGELVDFDVTLADGFRLFHGTGQVIDVGPGPEGGPSGQGITLRFSQLDQPSRNLVRKVVSKHIGEGGTLFVLATPSTKVEVVGDDEADTPEGQGRGPEDLVAPFAGLEGDQAWSGEQAPDLTSFLRPSGRGMDLEEEAAAPAGEFDSAPPTSSAETSVIETPAFETPAADTDDVDGEGERVPASETGLFGARADSLEVEAWNTEADEASESGVESEPSLAETQRIEPMAPAEDPQAEIPLAGGGEAFQPLPSTVIPPPFPQYGTDDESDGPESDELYTDGTSASKGRTWWPWVVVGGLAVGAGLYAVLQMDTPLSGLFGQGAESQQAASPEAGTGEPAPAVLDAAIELGAGAGAESSAQDVGLEGGPDEADAQADAPGGDGAGVPAGVVVADVAATSPPAAEASIPAPAVAEVEDSPADSWVGDSPELPAPAPLRLQRITWREVEGDTVIRLALSGPLADDRFETLRVPGGSPRLVLKVHGAAGGVPRDPVAIGSEHVLQLRFGVHNVDGVRQVHAVADLAEETVQMIGPVVIADGAVELRFSRP